MKQLTVTAANSLTVVHYVKAIISGNADAVATKFASSSLLQKQQANEPKTEDTSVKPHPIPVEFPNPKVH